MSSTTKPTKPTTKPRKNVGVLISGAGSNLIALHKATTQEDFPAQIGLVVSNRPDAPGIKWARDQGIAVLALDHDRFRSREEFDDQIHRIMMASKIDIIACAGFMRLMTPELVKHWHNRMINIHPSLLPVFKGLNTHARVLKAGVKITGCTVHAVRLEMDEGPILGQAAVPVLPGDTPDSLAKRVLTAEHKLYSHVLALFASDQIKIDGDKVENAGEIEAGAFEEALYSPALPTG